MVETGDDTSKQVLATMRALLRKDKVQQAATESEEESTEMPENVSPMDAMRSKPPRNT